MIYKIGSVVSATLDAEIHVGLHEHNSFCRIGLDLASEVAKRIPGVVIADKEIKDPDVAKLGTFSYAKLDNGSYFLNCYTQHHWDSSRSNEDILPDINPLLCDYLALQACLDKIKGKFDTSHKIGMPLIGYGTPNSDWFTVSKMIKETLIDCGYDITIYVSDEKTLRSILTSKAQGALT